MTYVTIDWYSDDPEMAELLRTVASYPEYSVERLELEAVLHEFMAMRLREQVGGVKREAAIWSRNRQTTNDERTRT